MGICRTTVVIEHPARRGNRIELQNVMVDTGSEYTWISRPALESLGMAPERTIRFGTADGRQIERQICFGIVYVAGTSAPEILVFAEEGDLALLGARALGGLNLRIDLLTKTLVPAGPVPAAMTRAA
jgi:predicted aspartyl protease